MHVLVHLKSYYDWQPVPADVKVTDKDVASGRVKPDAKGLGYLMRVTKKDDTYTTVGLSEGAIIARIIHEAMPQQGSRQLSRMEAVGQVLALQVMPNHAHPRHMVGFTVDVDDGPDEKLFRASLAPYVESIHDQSGEPLIAPEDIESMVAKYMAPVTKQEHVEHMHQRFGVKRSAA